MVKFNSQPEIVRQLIRSYFESCKLHEDLENLGISIDALDYLGEQYADTALDIIGFPVDDSAKEDDITFCRDYLLDAAPEQITPDTLNSDVENYVDFLYSEFEKLKQENPDLFE
ncbi:MAG: hypothetical protein K2M40_06615 [Muribaculaceae bacterium]|nr:hypothetical protein [Muribaculaceae bacterium]